MVSDDPANTLAIRPILESGELFLNICSRKESVPLPDIGRNSASGINSGGR